MATNMPTKVEGYPIRSGKRGEITRRYAYATRSYPGALRRARQLCHRFFTILFYLGGRSQSTASVFGWQKPRLEARKSGDAAVAHSVWRDATSVRETRAALGDAVTQCQGHATGIFPGGLVSVHVIAVFISRSRLLIGRLKFEGRCNQLNLYRHLLFSWFCTTRL